MLSSGKERLEKEPQVSPLSLLPRCLPEGIHPDPPYAVSFFSVYKDSRSEVLLLRAVTGASAILARRLVIYVLKKNIAVWCL